MELSAFEELLGPPLYDRPIETDWESFESFVSSRLPRDYKEFVSAYGPCCVGDTLLIFHPAAPRDDSSLNLFEEVEKVAGQYEFLRNVPSYKIPYAIYPEPGGCIPVARTTGGNQVFLRPPSGELLEWSVVVDMGEWVHFPSGFTYVLYRAVTGDLHVPFMADAGQSFEPVGRLAG
ncbi:hypothetical protein [Streptomyces sp. URMC 129]|uniref:hypothetical protein n=1 Tax=Streptomyces sp. URMC 129 TaxID=3423407 RepID=UPI003F1D0BEC